MHLNPPWIAVVLTLALPAFASSVNESAGEINVKIVYAGAESAATESNLQFIHARLNPAIPRGELSRTKGPAGEVLAFDFLPPSKGEQRRYRVRFHLAAALGAPGARDLRRVALKDADAVVFIADSDPARMKANLEALRHLKADLQAQGQDWATFPRMFQFINREHPKALSVEELSRQFQVADRPVVAAELKSGAGILDTVKTIGQVCLAVLKGEDAQKVPSPSPVQTATPPRGR